MSTFALSLPLVRFEGSKSYSPLLFFIYELKYILNTSLATRITIPTTNNMIDVSLDTDSVKTSTKINAIITIDK